MLYLLGLYKQYVIFCLASYRDALKKAKKAEETSDVQTEIDTGLNESDAGLK